MAYCESRPNRGDARGRHNNVAFLYYLMYNMIMRFIAILGFLTTLMMASFVAPSCAIAQTSTPVKSAPAGQTLDLQYKGFFGGIEAANITISQKEGLKNHLTQFELRSKGLIKKIWKFGVTATSDMARQKSFFQTTRFASIVSKNKKDKKYGWDFNSKTKLAFAPDVPNDQQPVGEIHRRAVVDPLSLLVLIPQAIRAKPDLNSLSGYVFPVYDGKRRYDVTVQNPRRAEEKIAGKIYKTIGLNLTINPIAGFKDRDTDLWKNTAVTALLSDDGRYIPIRIQADTPISPVIVQLQNGL